MTVLKRRGFLKLSGAVGVAPVVPALPVAPARATIAGGSGASAASKALWTSLHANAGNTSGFIGFARGLGLSNGAIHGIAARSIGVRLPLSALTRNVARRGAAQLTKGKQRAHDMMALRKRVGGYVEESLAERDSFITLETTPVDPQLDDHGRENKSV